MAFRIDPEVLARMEALGERANEGRHTREERFEYGALINAAGFDRSIARCRIKSNTSSPGSMEAATIAKASLLPEHAGFLARLAGVQPVFLGPSNG